MQYYDFSVRPNKRPPLLKVSQMLRKLTVNEQQEVYSLLIFSFPERFEVFDEVKYWCIWFIQIVVFVKKFAMFLSSCSKVLFNCSV